MDENKTYSAEDLLRYAHGQMSTAERYALEKAALEDPFLAEALDGFVMATDDGQQTKDMPQLIELRKIIAGKAADKKTEKLVPVVSILRSKWLQKAIAAVFILGAAWWLYSIANRPKDEPITANNKQIAQVQPPVVKDSVVANTTPKQEQASNPAKVNISTNQQQSNVSAYKTIQEDRTLSARDKETKAADDVKNEVVKAPTVMADSTNPSSKDVALSEVAVSPSSKTFSYKKEITSKTVVMGYGAQKKPEPELQNVTIAPQKPSFVFQGRILDANNNPLPFSNITIPGENFGTYSDGEGYFNFVSTDSILPVRAKSLGYETQNFNMSANVKENRIVLNDDKNMDKNLAFFRSAKQKEAIDFKQTIVKVDSIASTVEPFVGWKNYDLYLTNNNRISDLPSYSNRSVLLSFEVAKDGEIKNITVDKSQGKDLDAEAIRLLKEGPKWKVKKNGEKGKVEVKF